MKRSNDRILTTQMGSLPRGPEIYQLVAAREQGQQADEQQFSEMARQAVREVVKKQVETGLDSINDGEVARLSFTSYYSSRVTGFEAVESSSWQRNNQMGRDATEFPDWFANQNAYARPPIRNPTWVCTGPVKYTGQAAVQQDIDNVKAAAKEAGADELFLTAVSPGVLIRGIENRYYRTAEEYHQALVEAVKPEYQAIVNAGIVLQLDCPDLSGRWIRQWGESLEEAAKSVAYHVDLLNASIEGIDPEMVRVHVCWGAGEGPHHLDPPLDSIIGSLLKCRAAGLTIVGANPRHVWEWRVWQDVKVPSGMVIIPGVIDSTTNIIEHPDLVAERIERYANILGRENVIAGVDCGLATIAGANQVDPKIAWAKLRALVDGAEIASQHLWP